MTVHAKHFGASSWARWGSCPASVQLIDRIQPPGTSSPYAVEGSAIHKIGEMDLNGYTDIKPGMVYLNDIDEIVAAAHPLVVETFGPTIEINQEMIDLARDYATYCRNLKGDGQMLVEQRANYSHWVPEGFGTADCVILRGNKLIVVDLKCGRGERVESQDNGQMMLYALGTLWAWDFVCEFDTVETHIYQPRLDNISYATYTTAELYQFGDLAKAAAELALSQDPPYNPTEKGCRWCPVKAHCPAVAELAVRSAQNDFAEFAPTLYSADPSVATNSPDFYVIEDDDIPDILPFVDLLSDWASAIRQRAYNILRANGNAGVPGYKLVHGRSTRRWRDEARAMGFLEFELGVDGDDLYIRKPISPSQAEKILTPKDRKALADHIIKPEGALTLVPEDDKRMPASLTTAEDDFAHITTPEEGDEV